MENKKITRTHALLIALLLVIACAVVYPNSFGNNPDIIQDESYFLTSALSAVEKMTLPGWEFSPSGSYYGGVQTYLGTAALIPVIGYAVVAHHFSLLEAKVWLASHTGDLLHVLRVVNELLVVGAIAFFFWYFARRKIPQPLALQLLLVLFLVLGNSIVIGFLHTAKVWTLYLLIDMALGALFLANEYYKAHTGGLFISKKFYVPILVWGAVLAFFQNFVGIFSASLWTLYALLLGHIDLRDLWDYVRRHWYLIILFSLTQISFLYRGFFMRAHPSLLDLAENTTRTAGNAIDWFHRLYDPLINALLSQPLIVLYPLGVALAVALALRNREFFSQSRRRRYLLIACAHPLLVHLFFYGLLGFSLFPRFSLMLAVACSFSIAILLGENRKALISGLVLAAALCGAVLLQAIGLYWQPSSAARLEQIIAADYNSPEQVFIIEPSAERLSLPLNARSLAELNERRRALTRFQFLLQHPDVLAKQSAFRPLVLFADTEQEKTTLLRRASATSSVWTITQDCSRRCSAAEAAAGSCFMLNAPACSHLSPDDQKEYPVLLMPDFLRQSGLGITYIVRRVR